MYLTNLYQCHLKSVKLIKLVLKKFQLENLSAPARLSSARNLHSSGSLQLENSSSNSSLDWIGDVMFKESMTKS